MTSAKQNPSPQKNTVADLSDCVLCPRRCHVNRTAGKTGYCGQTADITAARAALHFWEEPCLSGDRGSGAVFFSGCNMRCVFCQNHEISAGHKGIGISTARLAEIFLELQEKGAHNINLVTPTHFVPQILSALDKAKSQGLKLPVIYNTSGYEEIDTLKSLEGYVDIYLPDLKFFSPKLSARYAGAPDYFAKASLAVSEMFRQVKTPLFEPYKDDLPLMKRGLIVRHLVLPGQVKDSKKILRFLHETYKNDIYVSIMNQYTPMAAVPGMPELDRKVSPEEYRRVVSFAGRLGVANGFIQEGDTAEESFIPPFDMDGVL